MRFILVLCLSMSGLATEIKGVVRNGSGEGLGTADLVQLVLLEEGMQVLGSASDVKGIFSFHVEQDLEGKQIMLQANKEGVLYTQPIDSLEGELSIDVFDVVDEGEIKASIGSFALYAYEQTMDIGIFYNLTNVTKPAASIRSGEGSFKFGLIPGASDIQANTQRGSMPLRQELSINDEGIATLNYTLKPGLTRLMLRTRHLYNPKEVNEYVLPLPKEQQVMKVLILPASMSIEGEGLTFIKEDKAENLNLYEFEPSEGQTELRLKVKGKPLDRSEAVTSDGGGRSAGNGGSDHSDAMKIERRPNVLSHYNPYIVGLVLLVLIGFGVLAKKS